MTVATGNFAELLWPGIAKIFGDNYVDADLQFKLVFDVANSDKAFEKEQGVTRLGLAAIKDQGDSVTFDDPLQGLQKEYVNITYGKGASVTREMFEDDMYNYINALPAMLARSLMHTEEVTHMDVLNNGFSTELTPDGLSVFNSAHTLVGGGTFRNQLATPSDLTQTALEQAFIDIGAFVDDRQLRIGAKTMRLVVPNELRFVAQKIVGTDREVGSADNTINPMNNAIPFISSVFLTDPDAWFIKTDVPNGARSYRRRAAAIERDNEFETQNLKFMTTARWAQGVTDPRGLFASPGA